MHRFFLTATISLVTLASCAVYKPEPVDLAKDTAEWRDRSVRLCPPGSTLDLPAMHSIGLLLNPELNKARVTRAQSADAARFAGLWADPSLSLDLERVLKENMTNPSIAPGLSLPVTGLPHLARRIAEQYTEADYWNLRAQERQFLSELDALRFRIMVTHERRRLMQERLEPLRVEYARITRLYELGEAELSDCQSATQRLNDTVKAFQELDKDHLAQHQELNAMLGLHPDVGEIELAGSLPGGVPAPVAVPAPDRLVESPSVKSALASYGAAEDELRAEIRRQYPELSISPGFAREDGEKKLMMGVEFSLPVWNRNRAAIAKAGGARSLQRQATLQAWRALLQESVSLQQQQSLARRHCLSEHERLSGLQAAADQQEKLCQIGETSLPALAEARHEMYQRRLSYLDCLAELLDIQTRIRYLNPSYVPS